MFLFPLLVLVFCCCILANLTVEKNTVIAKINEHLVEASPFRKWISTKRISRISHIIYGVEDVPIGTGSVEAFEGIQRITNEFSSSFHCPRQSNIDEYVGDYLTEFIDWLSVQNADKFVNFQKLDEQKLKFCLMRAIFHLLLQDIYGKYLAKWPENLNLKAEPDLNRMIHAKNFPTNIPQLRLLADSLCFAYSDAANLEWKAWYWAFLILIFLSIVVLMMILTFVFFPNRNSSTLLMHNEQQIGQGQVFLQ